MNDSLLQGMQSYLEEKGFWTLVGVCSLVFGSCIIAYDAGRKQHRPID